MPVGIIAYGTAWVPIWNIVIVPAVFAVITFATAEYMRWTARRDAARMPVHPVEWAWFSIVVLVGSLLALALVFAAATIGIVINILLDLWGGAV